MDRPEPEDSSVGAWLPLALWAAALIAGYLWVW